MAKRDFLEVRAQVDNGSLKQKYYCFECKAKDALGLLHRVECGQSRQAAVGQEQGLLCCIYLAIVSSSSQLLPENTKFESKVRYLKIEAGGDPLDCRVNGGLTRQRDGRGYAEGRLLTLNTRLSTRSERGTTNLVALDFGGE